MTTPSPDEFSDWKDHPVTQFVIAGLKRYAEAQQEAWSVHAWMSGNLDPIALAKAKTRAECFADLANLSYNDACGAVGVEPVKAAA